MDFAQLEFYLHSTHIMLFQDNKIQNIQTNSKLEDGKLCQPTLTSRVIFPHIAFCTVITSLRTRPTACIFT